MGGLKGLVQAKNPQDDNEKKMKKISNQFINFLDKTMERNIEKAAGSKHNTENGRDDSKKPMVDLRSEKMQLNEKQLDELKRQRDIDEEKRIKKRFDEEAERQRLANLERLRQENLLKKRELERLQEINRSKEAKKKEPDNRSKVKQGSNYNPLGDSSNGANSRNRGDPEDPSNDSRFVFSLALENTDKQTNLNQTNPKPKMGGQPSSISYNPLGSRNNTQSRIMTAGPAPPHQQTRNAPIQKERTPIKSNQVPQNAIPHVNRYVEEHRQMKPERNEQARKEHPPNYNPLGNGFQSNQTAKRIPPQIPRMHNQKEPVLQGEARIALDLAKLKNKLPPKSQMILPTDPDNEFSRMNNNSKEQKQKRINPKNHPEYIFCFKCQEHHHKDFHRIPQLSNSNTNSTPQKVKNSFNLTSQYSRGGQNQPDFDQRALLDHVLGKRSIQEHRGFHHESLDEGEEEDDFDYDDDFIDNGDSGQDYKKHLRRLTGYNPEAYQDEDFDDRDMEVRNFEELEREDYKSKIIGRISLLKVPWRIGWKKKDS